MAELQNAVFWIETDKIQPNPYQPRREFDEHNLRDLAESIRQYGVLQPLVVTRREDSHDDGSISVAYELIAGERRLRASKLAGVREVPCVVRVGDNNRAKLELAIIENIQREDLNAVDRAKSFQQLADEFKLSWVEIGKKVGKSREYVSNTVRILMLPQEILDALVAGKISEGHTRPLLMLVDKPDEQITLFKEMLMRKMTVREAEGLARRVALEKVRKKSLVANPEVIDLEKRLAESLGTRVSIEPKEKGGKITIDYFSHDELLALAGLIKRAGSEKVHEGMFDKIKKTIGFVGEVDKDEVKEIEEKSMLEIERKPETKEEMEEGAKSEVEEKYDDNRHTQIQTFYDSNLGDFKLEDDRSKEEIRNFQEREDDLYDIRNFSL
ncbi:MAG TPA: ParB/RepB/Spo0J family partition protein [Candidatus Paceibacterota bacterium]|jgi:ParB family chromosome partitioning protein|nr:ParB/RepB/Spo0J family partition protein [Candidatus Paceibacterota bacterium]HQB57004.1 ParB/RepB/Spo0J family partition protein [Candidatus Paceibacterota bacterium]